jgi:hypothetical protein
LQYILIVVIILFGLFGVVQLLECLGPLKGRSRASEMIYIGLSVSAKGVLGMYLFAQVLFI